MVSSSIKFLVYSLLLVQATILKILHSNFPNAVWIWSLESLCSFIWPMFLNGLKITTSSGFYYKVWILMLGLMRVKHQIHFCTNKALSFPEGFQQVQKEIYYKKMGNNIKDRYCKLTWSWAEVKEHNKRKIILSKGQSNSSMTFITD